MKFLNLLIVLFLFYNFVGCSRSSSCGELGNITYPYQLPGTCKWKAYELQCDGNDTVLYSGASKYLVRDISMENRTLRLVDPILRTTLKDSKLTVADWQFLVDKVSKKLQGWKGNVLSLGGRLTLINSVLSAVPLYTLSVYKAPKQIVKRLDTIRNRFLWQGSDKSRKKYALVKWSKACLAKTNGGLGILNFQEMNISLLLKWWWKFHNNNYSALWKSVIMHKYQYSTPPLTYSPFWAAIMKLDPLGKMSVYFEPGIQSSLEFWNSIWYGNCTLASQYPQLYSICTNKFINLSVAIHSQGDAIHFRRRLSGILLADWQALLLLISTSSFTHNYDKIAWRWSTSGSFSVSSIYRILNFRGINDNKYAIVWDLPIPPKIRVFIWLLLQNRILTKTNLSKRGWVGNMSCQFCSECEDTNHLFLTCQQAQKIWFWLGQSQNFFNQWHSITDIFEFAVQLGGFSQKGFLVTFSAVCWTIWKNRNALCFQSNASLKSIRTMILLIISIFEYWAGNMDKRIKFAAEQWLPEEINAIPLRTWDPDDHQVIDFQGAPNPEGSMLLLGYEDGESTNET